jgi:hypothetical protein
MQWTPPIVIADNAIVRVMLSLLWVAIERVLITNCLHGADLFLRSRQLHSYSRIFQHFMEPEVSLPCS